MKKQLALTALMAVTAFSSQASAGLAVKTALVGAGALTTAAFIMANESMNNLINAAHRFINEALNTTITQKVVTPLIRTATEKSQFLRKLVTGLAICAAVSFVMDKAVKKYDACTGNKALKKYHAKHGATKIVLNADALKALIERKK